MQQLDGLDAFFALNERQHTPMHIAALSVYKPSTTKHKNFLQQEIHQSFQERLSTSPIFRRRLFNVSYGMDHPYWIEDQNFDLKHHIFSHSIKNHNGDLESPVSKPTRPSHEHDSATVGGTRHTWSRDL